MKSLSKSFCPLYSVPYQHFINSIENYFSMMNSRLHKLEGLNYDDLKNIDKVVTEIKKNTKM